MRIGLLTTEFAPFFGGGIGTYCEAFAAAAAGAGHEIHVLCPGAEPADHDHATVHLLPSLPERHPLLSGLREFGDDYARAYFWADPLERLVDECRLDVLETQDYLAPAYFWLDARRRRTRSAAVPLVVKMHSASRGLWEVDGEPTFEYWKYTRLFMEEESVRHADAVVSPSTWLARRTERRLGLQDGSIHVCPYPLRDPGWRRHETCDPTVLFVGRLQRLKGVELLASVLPDLLRDRPGALARFVGGDWYDRARGTWMGHQLRQRLSAVGDRVAFDGKQPRDVVLEAMARAAVVVVPSYWDNFPNVCLEAMAAGAVVVGSTGGGMPEIVEDGVSGFLFESGDAAALERVLRHALDLTPAERLAIGRAARARVLGLCDPDRVVADRLAHFERTIERHRVASRTRRAGRARASRRVGVVVTCYNLGSTLPETLESVAASTRRPDRLLVVDDGSTDPETVSVLGGLASEVEVLRTPNRGLSTARNVGAAHVDTDTLLFLDADDLLAPDFITEALDLLGQSRRTGFVTPWAVFFGEGDGAFCPPRPHFPLLLNRNLALYMSLMRRRAFDDAGGYRPEMLFGYEDWQLWIAMLDRGWQGACLPSVGLRYRLRAGSMLRRINPITHHVLIERMAALRPRPYRRYGTEAVLLALQNALPGLGAEEPFGDVAARVAVRRPATLVVYGTGKGARLFLQAASRHGVEVSAFVTGDAPVPASLEGRPVHALSMVPVLAPDVIVLASLVYAAEMRRRLEDVYAGAPLPEVLAPSGA